MKQLYLYLILFSICSYSQSNEVVTIKINYSPETKYVTEIKQMTSGEMTYIAPENVLQRLRERGVSNPTPIQMDSGFKTILKTGKLSKEGYFPLTMLIIDDSGMFKLPDDMVIHGHGVQSQLPILDSIASDKLDYNFKKGFLEGMQNIFSQLSFPEKSVKVGESFELDVPLNIPMAGENIEMLIHCTYTLKKIAHEIAEYDVKTEYSLKSGIDSATMQAKGTGTGKLEYDIKNNFNKKYEVSSDLELTLIMEQMSIQAKMTMGQLIKVDIESVK